MSRDTEVLSPDWGSKNNLITKLGGGIAAPPVLVSVIEKIYRRQL